MTERVGLELVDVLLVEDDPGDVLMTREAFEHYRIPNNLHVVGDGEQAMHFLRKTGDYADVPTPGPHPARPQPAQAQRARGARRAEGRHRPAGDPGRGADHVAGGGGHPAQLLAARQRLHQQAGGLREVRRRDRADRRLLPDAGQAAVLAQLQRRTRCAARRTSGSARPGTVAARRHPDRPGRDAADQRADRDAQHQVDHGRRDLRVERRGRAERHQHRQHRRQRR